MRIPLIFRLIATVVIPVFLCLFAWGLVNVAHAQQDVSQCNSTAGNQGTEYWCSTRGQAYAAAQAHASALFARGTCPPTQTAANQVQVTGLTYSFQTCEPGQSDGGVYRRWLNDCPADQPWNPGTQQCQAEECPGGAILMTNGMCSPKPEECSARNSEPGFIGVGETTRNFASHCVGGCQFSVSGPHTQTTHGSRTMVTGEFEFTGAVCGASPSNPPQPDTDVKPDKAQECSPAGASQDFCVKANGDHCATSAAGRQICWKPGETGEKVDGKTLQKKQPGETPTPPRTPPPEGDEWTPPSTPIKVTTEAKDATGNVTNITTTVITNQTTKSGVDAGKGNQGEKGDGSGDDKGDSPDGEKGQYSKDCNTPPTCSQTDGIGCAMVRQQWSNKCDALQGDVNQIGNTNELPTDGLESSLIDVWDQGNGYIPGPTDVDTTGWSGRGSCPINLEFSAMGKSFNVNHPQLCEILDALAALIMIVGSWHAGFILTTGFRKG